jgi:hypothetical protein
MDLPQLKTLEKWPFLAEDDAIWEKWLKHKHISLVGDLKQEMIKLLGKEVRDSIKRRVIFLFLVPHVGLIPNNLVVQAFAPDSFDFSSCKASLFDIYRFSSTNLEFTCDLILEFYLLLKDAESVSDRNALHQYNSCVLSLLRALPPDSPRAEELFEQYLFFEECTHNQFALFMINEMVAEEWKRRADEKYRRHMIAVIESQRISCPSYADHRSLVFNYVQSMEMAVEIMVEKTKPRYSKELFLSQLELLLSEEIPGYNDFSDFVHKIYSILAGEENKERRRRLARYLMNNGYNSGSQFFDKLFELILTEFGDDDPEIRPYVENQRQMKMNRENKERTAREAEARYRREKFEENKAILTAMK